MSQASSDPVSNVGCEQEDTLFVKSAKLAQIQEIEVSEALLARVLRLLSWRLDECASILREIKTSRKNRT